MFHIPTGIGGAITYFEKTYRFYLYDRNTQLRVDWKNKQMEYSKDDKSALFTYKANSKYEKNSSSLLLLYHVEKWR